MTTALTSTIVGVFRDRAHAEQAVQDLIGIGIPRQQMSVVATDARATGIEAPQLLPDADIGGDDPTGRGVAVGGFFGFIAGIAALAIPGIGPILAAGPLAAGIMGAGLGAAAGGLTGALSKANIPEEKAHRYSEAIRKGSILLAVHVPEDRVDAAADVMDRNGAYDIDERESDALPVTGAGSTQPVGTVTTEGVRAARLTPETSVREKQKEREGRIGIYPGVTGGGEITDQLR